MILKEIEIISYKSICNKKIYVSENCLGLIGLNESGKTNILSAIRSLNPRNKFKIGDKSKITGELPEVKFTFSFENKEYEEIREFLKNKVIELTQIEYEDLIQKIEVNKYTETSYLSVTQEDRKEVTFWSGNVDYNLLVSDEFYYLESDTQIPENTTIVYEETSFDLKSLKVIKENLIPEDFKECYKKLDLTKLRSLVSRDFKDYLHRKVPRVIFWTFNPKYLIPQEITYDDFTMDEKPYENSAPLFNIFRICKELEIKNVKDLNSKISEWRIDSSIRRKDASIVNREINKYIKSKWEDYDQDLEIGLEENKVTVHIKDPKSTSNNYYDMESRSQGAQTFISFILTIAAEAETKLISNFILILDEPETHLHPSGVKFMRNELLKLSKSNNYIFYATHSIFMIDRQKLTRHLIIKKENELTNIEPVKKNNLIQEAVLYEALGTSTDEFSIPANCILFEGGTDIKVFNLFLINCIKQKDRSFLEGIELLNGGGVRDIERFFKNKVLPKDFKWLTILDNDSPGKKLAKEVFTHVPEHYEDNLSFIFYSNIDNFELEDILDKNIAFKALNNSLKKMDKDTISDFNIDKERSISSFIEEHKSRNSFTDSEKLIFEEYFKKEFDDEVENFFDEIKKEKNFSEKLKKFKNRCPLYVQFINKVFKHFGEQKI